MWRELMIIILSMTAAVLGQPGKCDQTPPGAKVLTPSENKDIPFKMRIITNTPGKYLMDQTYVLILETDNTTRPFREFMITAEDPDVGESPYQFEHRNVDVGSLKTLGEDAKSRYSERCSNTVENTDASDKNRIETHWVSPKDGDQNKRIRFRAMVAENKEVWYTGGDLTITLEKDDARPIDSPPYKPNKNCNLCSEARYEVIFKGRWSRGTHPRNYPSRPDDNGYSHMIGASHDFNYILWQPGVKASEGLKKLAEEANITQIEREIIDKMSETGGTRTLIRGKRHQHPYMHEPSHSLFRVDRIHHLFSIAVAMRPSPDWFLGTTNFELCTEKEWLPHWVIPLYPWDAGTMDGISYESARSVTQPEDNVERVAVGSFNRESPFFQMNLNDLKPFAELEVRRLDVYPLVGVDCEIETEDDTKDSERKYDENNDEVDEYNDGPLAAESRQEGTNCLSEWSLWTTCVPDAGLCGTGTQMRVRYELNDADDNESGNSPSKMLDKSCVQDEDGSLLETQQCIVNCRPNSGGNEPSRPPQ